MIGNITTGSGYGGVNAYVNGKDGAEVIAHTMSGDEKELWASEMYEHAQALNPGLAERGGHGVVHVSISSPDGEHLNDAEWRAVVGEYLEQMGWQNHDYIATRHTDADHDHVHLIVNRVGRDGETADLKNDFIRQERALDAIEQTYGLTQSHAMMRDAIEHDPYSVAQQLTKNGLTFSKEQVEYKLARAGFTDEKIKELTPAVLSDSRVLGTQDGRFTTADIQRTASKLKESLNSLTKANHGALRSDSTREGAVWRKADGTEFKPSDEQRAALRAAESGAGLVVIEGYAGAGKSTLMNQLRGDFEAQGYDVIGTAFQGKAASGLQASSGIESHTLDSLIGAIERGQIELTRDTVVVLDEAAMVDLERATALVTAVDCAGARLVKVGDERQIGAFIHDGAFRAGKDAVRGDAHAVLATVYRQRDGVDAQTGEKIERQWMRDASEKYGEGRLNEALQDYAEHGSFHVAASRGTARDMLVEHYFERIDSGARRPEEMLALARLNSDVDKINMDIRAGLQERGVVGQDVHYLMAKGQKDVMVTVGEGDRVMITRNQSIDGERVMNGQLGTVTKTESTGFHVRMDDTKKEIFVEAGAWSNKEHGHITSGYAVTYNKSQGVGVEETLQLYDKRLSAQQAGVGATRHYEETSMFVGAADYRGKEGQIVGADRMTESQLGGAKKVETVKAAIAKVSQTGRQENIHAVASASAEAKGKEYQQTKDQGHGPAAPVEGKAQAQQSTGAERFGAVLKADRAKTLGGERFERAQAKGQEKNQGHGPRGAAGDSQRHAQPARVESGLVAATVDERKISSGMEQRGESNSQTRVAHQGHVPAMPAEEKGQERQAQPGRAGEKAHAKESAQARAADQSQAQTGQQAGGKDRCEGQQQGHGQQEAGQGRAGKGRGQGRQDRQAKDQQAGQRQGKAQAGKVAGAQGAGKGQVGNGRGKSEAQGKGESKSKPKGYGL